MRKEPPILSCAFGWGKVFHLCQDYLDIHGRHYALAELKEVHPIYRQFFGVSSARLELVFGKKKVVLRGIVALEELTKIVEILSIRCSSPADLQSADSRQTEESGQSNEVVVAVDEKEDVEQGGHKGVPVAEQGGGYTYSSQGARKGLPVARYREPITGDYIGSDPGSLFDRPTLPVEIPSWLRLLQEQHERRQRRIHAERSLRTYGFDLEKLEQRLQLEPLPCVQVPVRLAAGEDAHYRTEATLCGEPIGKSTRYVYPALDYGLLILTNWRLIYIGRKSQVVLDYARLLHVSRLHNALAFEADHWRKRVIVELSRPLECVMYLECILQRFPQNEHAQVDETMNLDTMQHGQFSLAEEEQKGLLANGYVDTTPLPMYNWDAMDTLARLERENLEAYEEGSGR